MAIAVNSFEPVELQRVQRFVKLQARS